MTITRFEIKEDGAQRVVTDLCDDDAAPLRDVLSALPKSVRQGRKRRTFEDDMVDPTQE